MLKQTIGLTGFELVRKSAAEMIPQNDWLKAYDIRTFIDIGAHKGEYVDFCRAFYPRARVFAIEPLADCAEQLSARYAADSRVRIFNFALSDYDDSGHINRSSYAPSSSLLKMASLHKETFPESAGETLQPVEVRRLDGLVDSIPLEPELFVKIDVQGSEDKVIAGGKNVLSQARIIQTEVSFETLYEDQALFDTVYHQLRDLGFDFRGIKNQVRSPKDGTIMQAHAYFIRKD